MFDLRWEALNVPADNTISDRIPIVESSASSPTETLSLSTSTLNDRDFFGSVGVR